MPRDVALRAVVGVELHVAYAEIRGLQGIGAWPLADADVHGDVDLLERSLQLGVEVALQGLALAEELDAAEGDGDGLGLHVDAGTADGGHDAAPVGVHAEHGGLDELGMADGAGHLLGIPV